MAAWPVPGVPAGTGLVRLRKFLTPGTQTITMTEAAGVAVTPRASATGPTAMVPSGARAKDPNAS
jgi:hypothetical protein